MNEQRAPATASTPSMLMIDLGNGSGPESMPLAEVTRRHAEMFGEIARNRKTMAEQFAVWGFLLMQIFEQTAHGFWLRFLESQGVNRKTADRARARAAACMVGGRFERKLAAEFKGSKKDSLTIFKGVRLVSPESAGGREGAESSAKPARAVVLDEADFAKPDPSARAMTDAEILASDINDVELRRLEAERDAEEFGDSEDFGDEDFAGGGEGDEAAGGEAEVCPHSEAVEQDTSDESGARVKNGQHGRAGDGQVPSSPAPTDAPGDRDVAGRIGNGGARVMQETKASQLSLATEYELAERMRVAAHRLELGHMSDAHRRRMQQLLDEIDGADDKQHDAEHAGAAVRPG